MVVSFTPIIPATSAAAKSSVSRAVPLPFSMLSSSFPLLQMRSLPWLRYSVYYTDSSFHDYTAHRQARCREDARLERKGSHDHQSHNRQHRGAAGPQGREAEEHRGQVGLTQEDVFRRL